DRLETDIFMGQQAGMQTAATMTGASTRADVAKMTTPPTHVIDSLAELPGIISGT
ncbi:MAG: HAD hydrolase-like protein, partial [Chloroflexota bacterium]